MKFHFNHLSVSVILCASLLFTSAANCFSLDREAFTFTNYDLTVRIEPEQQRLGVRGKITLRNDSQTAQKIAVLQISSSLDWRSIKVKDKDDKDKAVQYVTQPYTSDIDHTGSLSEAIVTLPEAVPPKGMVELEIAYEGVIVLDATRLTRLGAPESVATSTDWDQISAKFTAVRGAGYVTWYPIATDSVDISEGGAIFEVLSKWKSRETDSSMHLQMEISSDSGELLQDILVNNVGCRTMREGISRAQRLSEDCTFKPMGLVVPTFLIAAYQVLEHGAVEVHYLPGHDLAAESYADAAAKLVLLISEWFGALREKARTADLADPDAAPFESGPFLLTPLAHSDPKLAGLAAAHQLTHAAFFSSRPWINEGLAHFAQALYLEQQKGRQSALDYMGLHRAVFSEADKPGIAPHSDDEVNRSLVNTTTEELYRSKAMYVWWMLRDMAGEPALKKALAAYRPEQDKEPSYMPRLIAAQTQRDLEWFFDDWVYRDRGVPDFKIESGFSRKTLSNAFMLTITVDNLGNAGAEVPLTVTFAGGEITKRVEVRAKNKAVIRVEVQALPAEIVVNDGSVPESDLTNNTFKVEAVADSH